MTTELAEIDPSPTPPSPSAPPPMTLSWLERNALHVGLPADDPQLANLDQLVLRSAQALAGPDRAETRLRMTAKALAMARAKLLVIEAHLDGRLAAGDDKGVQRASKIVEGARRHFVALLAEHRHACDGERRAPIRVTVGQVGAVNVMSVGGGSYASP